jgi:hypothetical protein
LLLLFKLVICGAEQDLLLVKFKLVNNLYEFAELVERLFVLVRVVDVEDSILIPPATPLTTKLSPLKLLLPTPLKQLTDVGNIENEDDGNNDDELDEQFEEKR